LVKKATLPPYMDSSIIFARRCQSAPLSNIFFLGLTRTHNPNGISIGSAVFAGLTIVTDRTDRQTDRPCYLVCNNRWHLGM